MTRTFFITGTDTGVGKTVLTALLAGFLRQRGARVAALKPVCSGGRGDARLLHRAMGGAISLDEINPWHYRAAVAPVLAAEREGKTLAMAAVVAHIRAIQKRFDWVLVEGAGGLLSPLGADFDSRALIFALRAVPVVVAPNQLGVVNHIVLTLEALRARSRAAARVVLMAPPRRDSATASNVQLLERMAIRTVCQLPRLGGKFAPEAMARRPGLPAALAAVIGPAGSLGRGDGQNPPVGEEFLLPCLRQIA